MRRVLAAGAVMVVGVAAALAWASYTTGEDAPREGLGGVAFFTTFGDDLEYEQARSALIAMNFTILTEAPQPGVQTAWPRPIEIAVGPAPDGEGRSLAVTYRRPASDVAWFGSREARDEFGRAEAERLRPGFEALLAEFEARAGAVHVGDIRSAILPVAS